MSSAVDLVDAATLARDHSRPARVPSITGTERAAARGARAPAPPVAFR